jgi:hypothetical protein
MQTPVAHQRCCATRAKLKAQPAETPRRRSSPTAVVVGLGGRRRITLTNAPTTADTTNSHALSSRGLTVVALDEDVDHHPDHRSTRRRPPVGPFGPVARATVLIGTGWDPRLNQTAASFRIAAVGTFMGASPPGPHLCLSSRAPEEPATHRYIFAWAAADVRLRRCASDQASSCR